MKFFFRMPIQAPNWTEYLSCPVCCHEFAANLRPPISLGCGHTICRTCLATLHRKQCPFDQVSTNQKILLFFFILTNYQYILLVRRCLIYNVTVFYVTVSNNIHKL